MTAIPRRHAFVFLAIAAMAIGLTAAAIAQAAIGRGDRTTVPESLRLRPDVAERARASAVLVQGEGCLALHLGSGVVTDRGIVTNAHVVAGTSAVRVGAGDERVDATVVAIDPKRDLAVLAPVGADLPALVLGDARPGDALVLGRRDDTVELLPATIDRLLTLVVDEIHGQGQVRRSGMQLSSGVAPGDSGAAVVDPEGRLVGIVFSASSTRPGIAYAVTAAEIAAVTDGIGASPVDLGACVD